MGEKKPQITIYVPNEAFRARFKEACGKTRHDQTAIGAALLEAFIEQSEAGERLVPPFRITEKKPVSQ